MTPDTAMAPRKPHLLRRLPIWALVLIIGLIAWAAAIVAVIATKSMTLVPSVILVGSFVMPVTFLAWVFARQERTGRTRDGLPTALSTARVFMAFVMSGLFGVSIAAILETYLLAGHLLLFYPGVAFIEELIKLLLIIAVGRGLVYYARRDGMVLGAAVGFGFAAFESAGYAFSTIFASDAVNIHLIIETEVVRGLLTPFAHGLWSALVGGALFHAAAAHGSRFRVTGGVIGWYLVAVGLHAIWDMANGVAIALTYLVTHQPISINAIERGRLPNPTQAQATFDGVFDWVLLGICSLIGIWVANFQWREGRAEAQRQSHELLHYTGDGLGSGPQ